VARGNAAPTQQAAETNGEVRSSPAGQLAAWSETFLVPLVAALERQVERVAQLERENGRQAAELERATSLAVKLSDELDTARAQISTLEARTAPQSAEPAPGPFSGRLHEWVAAAVAVLAIVAVVVLLAWPW